MSYYMNRMNGCLRARNFNHFFGSLAAFTILFFMVSGSLAAAGNKPDTTTSRFATKEDAAYWPSVNEGDYIFFTGNTWEGKRIYATPGNIGLKLPVGGKIFIWRGDYQRIHIDGSACESTEETPTIVTNLGGQVRVGNNENNDIYRGLGLVNFQHLHLTGKYDPELQTGDPNYRGHDGGKGFDQPDYYERYGIWANPRWSGPRFHGSYGNGVIVSGSDTLKINYVSSWGGSFAAFNLKTNNPQVPGRVKYDIQDNFAGFGEGEGFYIGYSATRRQDLIQLIMRNNIVMMAGTESYQTSNLAAGSIIENNVSVVSATFYRHPFMTAVQDSLHQIGFVEGDVTIRNNFMIGTNRGLHPLFFSEPEEGRANRSPDRKMILENNYYGFSRYAIGFINQGQGITPLVLRNNVYGYISVPSSDASGNPYPFNGFMNINNDANPIYLEDNIYPPGLPLYAPTRGVGNNITATNNTQKVAPRPEFVNLGFPKDFDYLRISFYNEVYKNVQQEDLVGTPIPYQKGEIVIIYDNDGETLFYKCIQSHDTPKNPLETEGYWEHMTWDGRNLPPMDPRLKADTYYNYRGMGLTYNMPNQKEPDFESPVIELKGGEEINFQLGSPYVEPGYRAYDNRDGDIAGEVKATWIQNDYDPDVPGIYWRKYTVSDSVGNPAIPVLRKVHVSESNVVQKRQLKLNLHHNSPTDLDEWTNLGNDNQGVRAQETVTELYDSRGNLAGVTLLIENIRQGHSRHYGGYRYPGESPAVEGFPAEITRSGLRVRDLHNEPAILLFEGLDSDSVYDVLFTGFVGEDGPDLKTGLYHKDSGQEVIIDIRGEDAEVGRLYNLAPNEEGSFELGYFVYTPRAEGTLSGLILTEKSGYGKPDTATFPRIELVQVDKKINLENPEHWDLRIAESPSEREVEWIWTSSDTSVIPHDAIAVRPLNGGTYRIFFNAKELASGTTTLRIGAGVQNNYSVYEFPVEVAEG